MSAKSPDAWAMTLNGLSKRFGPDVLFEDLDLRIEPGMAIGLRGANGAGKTQFLLALCGLATLDGGSVLFEVDGRAETLRGDPYSIDGAIRYVPGSLFSLIALDVGDLGLALSRALRPLGFASRRRVVRAHFAGVRQHLEHMVGASIGERTRVSELSIGQQRRLTIGAVTAGTKRPRLLLVDEPLAGLDSQGIARVLGVLTEVRRSGVALIVAEHRTEIEALGFDSVLEMPYSRQKAETPPTIGVTAIGKEPSSLARPMPRLAIRSARAGYPRAAVTCEELVIGVGEIAVLTGSNGAGKTGFLRALTGQPPARFEGDLQLDGQSVADLGAALTSGVVRYMSQDRHTFPDMRARDALDASARPGETIPPELREIVESIGRRKVVRHLSAGNRALLCLAQALASRPHLVLLDEPFANVDTTNRGRMAALISHAREAWATSFLVVEHVPPAGQATLRYHLASGTAGIQVAVGG